MTVVIAMRKTLLPGFRAILTFLAVAAFSLVSSTAMAQDSTAAAEGDLAVGKKLWNNCAACHKIDAKLIGPALGQVTEKYDEDWLIAWIRNNQTLRESGDAQALAIYEEYNGLAMPAYPQFSDNDIRGLLAYIDQQYAAKQVPTTPPNGNGPGPEDNATGSIDTVLVLAGMIVFLTIIVLILVRIKNLLLVMKGMEPRSFVDQIFDLRIYGEMFLANKKLVGLAVVTVLIFIFHGLWGFLKGIGVEQNYQPMQPIAFFS